MRFSEYLLLLSLSSREPLYIFKREFSDSLFLLEISPYICPMKIINEYLIVNPVTGEVEKYVELEGEVFFKVSLVKYYWVSKDTFYERYEETKKTFGLWKETIK